MSEKLTVDRVIGLAESGEVFTLNGAEVPLQDLLAIASAASRSAGVVRLCGIGERPLEDLMRIAVAGQDHVILDERAPSARKATASVRRTWFGLKSRTARDPVPAPVRHDDIASLDGRL